MGKGLLIMAISLITAAIIGAAITGGAWLMLDKVYQITEAVAGPVGDLTESVKEVVKSAAGKIGIAGVGLILLGLGIAAVTGAFKKIRK